MTSISAHHIPLKICIDVQTFFLRICQPVLHLHIISDTFLYDFDHHKTKLSKLRSLVFGHHALNDILA